MAVLLLSVGSRVERREPGVKRLESARPRLVPEWK